MEDRMRRLEQRAERAAGALEALADEPDMARIALVGVLCSAAVCWFAIAWGEPRLLVALPLVTAAAVAVARYQRRREAGETDDAKAQPAPAEVDEWLARLKAPPEPYLLAPPPSSVVAPPAVPPEAPAPDPALDIPGSAPVYEVREVRAGAHIVLELRDSFDTAVDAAFELIEDRDPPELEIVVVTANERDIVWSYTREAAHAEKPKGSLELYGFDAERWTQARR
jgi:hypothetical protein